MTGFNEHDLGAKIDHFEEKAKQVLGPEQKKSLKYFEHQYPWHPGYFCSLKEYAGYLAGILTQVKKSFQFNDWEVLTGKAGFDICLQLEKDISPLPTESNQNFQFSFTNESKAKHSLLSTLIATLSSMSNTTYPVINDFTRELTLALQEEMLLNLQLEEYFGENVFSQMVVDHPDEVVPNSTLSPVAISYRKVTSWSPPEGITAQLDAIKNFIDFWTRKNTRSERRAIEPIDLDKYISELHDRMHAISKILRDTPEEFFTDEYRAGMENQPDHPGAEHHVRETVRKVDALMATYHYLSFRLKHAQALRNNEVASSAFLSRGDRHVLNLQALTFLHQPGEVEDLPWLGKRDWIPLQYDTEENISFPCKVFVAQVPSPEGSGPETSSTWIFPHLPSNLHWKSLPNTTERLSLPLRESFMPYFDHLTELLQTPELRTALMQVPALLNLIDTNPAHAALKLATWAKETAVPRPDLISTQNNQGKFTRQSQLQHLLVKYDSPKVATIPSLSELQSEIDSLGPKKMKYLGFNMISQANAESYVTQQHIQAYRLGIEQEIYTEAREPMLQAYKTLLAYIYRWGAEETEFTHRLRKNYLLLLSNGLSDESHDSTEDLEITHLDYFDAFMLLASELLLANDSTGLLSRLDWLDCTSTFGNHDPSENVVNTHPQQIRLMMYLTYFKMPEVQKIRYAKVIEHTFEQVNRLYFPSTQEIPLSIKVSEITSPVEAPVVALLHMADMAVAQNLDLGTNPAWTTTFLRPTVTILDSWGNNELRIDEYGRPLNRKNIPGLSELATRKDEEKPLTLEVLKEKIALSLSVEQRRPELAKNIKEALQENPEVASVETTTQLFSLLEIILGWDLEENEKSIDFTSILIILGKLRVTTQNAAFASVDELTEAFQELQDREHLMIEEMDISTILQLILVSAGYAERELLMETLFNSLEGIDTVLGIKIAETLEELEKDRLSQWLTEDEIPKNSVFAMRTSLQNLQKELEEKNKNVTEYSVLDDPKYLKAIEACIKKLLKLYTGNRSYNTSMSSIILSLRRSQKDGSPFMSRCNVDGQTMLALIRVVAPQFPSFHSLTYGPGVELPLAQWLKMLSRDGQWGQQSHSFCTTGNESITAIVDGTVPFGGYIPLKEKESQLNQPKTAPLKWGKAYSISPNIIQQTLRSPPTEAIRMCVSGGSVFAAETAEQANLPALIGYIANPDHFGTALSYITEPETPQAKKWQALKKLIAHEPKILGFHIENDKNLGHYIKQSKEILELCLSHGREGQIIAVFLCNILLHNKTFLENPALRANVILPAQNTLNSTLTLLASTPEILTREQIISKAKPYSHLMLDSDVETILKNNAHFREILAQKQKEEEHYDARELQKTVLTEQTLRIEQSSQTLNEAASQVRAAETVALNQNPTLYMQEAGPVRDHIRAQTEEVIFQTNATAFGETTRLIQIGSEAQQKKALSQLLKANGVPLTGEPLQKRLAALQLILFQVDKLLPRAGGLAKLIQSGFQETVEEQGLQLPLEWIALNEPENLVRLARLSQNDPLLAAKNPSPYAGD